MFFENMSDDINPIIQVLNRKYNLKLKAYKNISTSISVKIILVEIDLEAVKINFHNFRNIRKKEATKNVKEMD